MLLGKAAKVGYFRPIIDNLKDGKMDNHIRTMINHFELIIAPKDAYVFTRSELIHLLNKGKEGEIVSKIIDKYKTLEDQFDFILVEGSDFSGESSIIEWDIILLIAKKSWYSSNCSSYRNRKNH